MSSLHMSLAGLDALQRGMAQAPGMTQRELLEAATQSTLLVEREVKDRLPRGATGLTAASITSDAFSTPAGVIGTVGSSLASAAFVELGTKAHMPPVAALIPWVRAVLGVSEKRAPSVAFLVARKIAKKGTKPQKHFANAAAATEGQVLRMFEGAAARIATQMNGGIA